MPDPWRMIKQYTSRAFWKLLRVIGKKQRVWDSQYHSGLWSGGDRSPEMIKMAQQLCHGGVLVEFGCGEGELPFLLPPGSFSTYTGYDISAVAIDRATHRARTSGIESMYFIQQDMAKWRGAQAVSLILIEECLYYLSSKECKVFLSTCCDSLVDDGVILVIVHSAAKHARTVSLCRSACKVIDEFHLHSRVYLTLAPRQSQ